MAHAWVSLAPTLASLTETLLVDVVIGGHWGSGRKGEECQDEMLPNLIIPICRQTVKMILSICWHILWSFQNSILFDETSPLPLICVLCTRLIILNMFLHKGAICVVDGEGHSTMGSVRWFSAPCSKSETDQHHFVTGGNHSQFFLLSSFPHYAS